MASVVSVNPSPNPMLTLEDIAQGLQGIRGQSTRTKAMQQQMAQAKVMNPIYQQMAQTQLANAQAMNPVNQQLAQQKLKQMQLANQYYPQMMALKASQSRSVSPYTVTSDPVHGGFLKYDKTTGDMWHVGIDNKITYLGKGSDPSQMVQTQPSAPPSQGQPKGHPLAPAQQQANLSAASLTQDINPASGLGQAVQYGQHLPSIYDAANLSINPASTRYAKGFRDVNPQTGQATYYTSPTTSTQSLVQRRDMGTSAYGSLTPWIQSVQDNYRSSFPMRDYHLMKDIFEYERTSDPTEKEMLKNKIGDLYAYHLLVPEAASLLSRTAMPSGQGDQKARQEFRKMLTVDMPSSWYYPKDIIDYGSHRYTQKYNQLVNAEQKIAAAGFPYRPNVKKPLDPVLQGKNQSDTLMVELKDGRRKTIPKKYLSYYEKNDGVSVVGGQ